MSNFSKSESVIFARVRIIATIVVAILIVCLLLWNHFHGGVPGHHILQREDFPEISNWWGVVVLPALAWITVGKVKKRLEQQRASSPGHATKINKTIGLFSTGLVIGMSIAISFINNYTPFLDNVPYMLLLLSLIIPIFYSEFFLGFVLAMTYTFGAILPTVFVLILSVIGFLLFKLRTFVFQKLFKQNISN